MTTNRRHRPSAALVVAVAALLVAIGGSAIAAVGAIPSDGRFTACYQSSADLLSRIVLLAEPGEKCPDSYARVSWPAQASAGAVGPAGPPGPQGSRGPAGPAGPAGQRGAAGGSSASATVYTVVKRELTVRRDADAVARCPKGHRAVGGGGITGGQYHALRSSLPYLENHVAVGWAVRPYELRSFRIFENVPQTTRSGGVPSHEHDYFLGPFLMAEERRGFEKRPAEITVYAVCVGTRLSRTGKGQTRSGG